jgi:hypothetical protein
MLIRGNGRLAQASGAMQAETFQAALLSGHKGCAAEVPFDPGVRWSLAAQPLWSGRRGFPVHASLNGKQFESAIVPRSRKFWLLVPEEILELAAVPLGELGSFAVMPDNSFKPARARGVSDAP